jgi:AcrR family transcriptional regulator
MAKRGRKSIAKERRAQILDAFHRCAVRSGLEKASLREVAAEAGLPVSNLHHYFKNRDEMVSELVKRIMGGIIDTLRDEIQGLGDSQTRLNSIFEFLFSPKAQKLEDGSLYYDFWSLAHRSKTIRRTFQNQIRDQRETIYEMLLATNDLSELSQADKREVANIIIALVEGIFFILDMDGENVSSKKMARLTTRFLELYASEKAQGKCN